MLFLRYLEPAVELVLFLFLFHRGWAKRLPWFCSWICALFLCGTVTLAVPYPSALYNAVASCPIPVLTLLQLLAVLRCTEEVLKGYSRPDQQQRIGMYLYTCGLAIAILAVSVTVGELCPHPRWIQSCLLVWRLVSWMGAAVLVMLSLCARFMPARLSPFLGWHRATLGVCCLCIAISLELSVMRSSQLSLMGAYTYEISMIACCAIWIVAVIRSPRASADTILVTRSSDPVTIRYRKTLDQVQQNARL